MSEIQDPNQPKPRKKAKFGEGMGSFTLAVLAILAFRWAIFEPYVIPSGSMIPTLLVHDHILVNKFRYGLRVPFTKNWLFKTSEPKRGDIVVFRSVDNSGYFMIKRVMGIPGDKIQIGADGYVSINGERLPTKPLTMTGDGKPQAPYYQVSEDDIDGEYERYDFFEEKVSDVTHRSMLHKSAQRYFTDAVEVPPNQYFVMGDNRDNSKDSRYWGTLPRENLLGKAMFIWLSCENTLEFVPFLCNPLELRWGRFFNGLK